VNEHVEQILAMTADEHTQTAAKLLADAEAGSQWRPDLLLLPAQVHLGFAAVKGAARGRS
jgi:hypothetical protein